MSPRILTLLALPLLGCIGEPFTTGAPGELAAGNDAGTVSPAPQATGSTPDGDDAAPAQEPDASQQPTLHDAGTGLPDGDTCLAKNLDGAPGCLFVLTAAAKACAPGCLGKDGQCHGGVDNDRICGTAVSRADGLCQDCVSLGAWCNHDQECSQEPKDGGPGSYVSPGDP